MNSSLPQPEPVMNVQTLLVDDDPVQSEVRRAVLARSGSSIITARSGEDALVLLRDEHARKNIGLLVTDHLMPGMNGPELVARVRELMPDLPVLVLSGLPDAEEEYAGMPILFRLKPFPPNELIRLVRHMLGDRILRSA